jgi:uncharacterized glyoxalase superfamily protein PhnB
LIGCAKRSDLPSAFESRIRARRSGGTIIREPTDYPYGERQYNIEDFAGHHWCFSESIADVDPREWGGTPAEL